MKIFVVWNLQPYALGRLLEARDEIDAACLFVNDLSQSVLVKYPEVFVQEHQATHKFVASESGVTVREVKL